MIQLLSSFSWTDLLQPQWYIENGGLWLILFVVFAETGLFAGFFLPGDTLLFIAGIFAHEDNNGNPGLGYQFLKLLNLGHVRNEWLDLIVLCVLISIAGIIGNIVGYWTGKKVGPAMYNWKENFFFKQRYLTEAHNFYEKHGGGAIIVARFLPFIRTFAPIIAGIVKMKFGKFMFFNIIGCIAWVFSLVFAGHFLQSWLMNSFGFNLLSHIEYIVLGIVFVTTAPIVWKLIQSKRKAKAGALENAEVAEAKKESAAERAANELNEESN